MVPSSRRGFMVDVGRGMLVAGLGASVAGDLGFSTAYAAQGKESVHLGEYESLVRLLQSTPPEKLQELLVGKLNRGEADLKTLISAGALANAETFGGQDYVGFHTAMAMLPALQMTDLMATERRPLPVLKVLYRNTQQCQQHGGATVKTLMAIHAAEHAAEGDLGIQIRDAARRGDMEGGEKLFSTVADAPMEEMFNILQPVMQDDINVHRFVFAHRT